MMMMMMKRKRRRRERRDERGGERVNRIVLVYMSLSPSLFLFLFRSISIPRFLCPCSNVLGCIEFTRCESTGKKGLTETQAKQIKLREKGHTNLSSPLLVRTKFDEGKNFSFSGLSVVSLDVSYRVLPSLALAATARFEHSLSRFSIFFSSFFCYWVKVPVSSLSTLFYFVYVFLFFSLFSSSILPLTLSLSFSYSLWLPVALKVFCVCMWFDLCTCHSKKNQFTRVLSFFFAFSIDPRKVCTFTPLKSIFLYILFFSLFSFFRLFFSPQNFPTSPITLVTPTFSVIQLTFSFCYENEEVKKKLQRTHFRVETSVFNFCICVWQEISVSVTLCPWYLVNFCEYKLLVNSSQTSYFLLIICRVTFFFSFSFFHFYILLLHNWIPVCISYNVTLTLSPFFDPQNLHLHPWEGERKRTKRKLLPFFSLHFTFSPLIKYLLLFFFLPLLVYFNVHSFFLSPWEFKVDTSHRSHEKPVKYITVYFFLPDKAS